MYDISRGNLTGSMHESPAACWVSGTAADESVVQDEELLTAWTSLWIIKYIILVPVTDNIICSK